VVCGCALPPQTTTDYGPLPYETSRRVLSRYRELPRVIVDQDGKRWIITPQAVLQVSSGFFEFEFAADEGLEGSILSFDHDPDRIWLGTTDAVQTLEKDTDFIRTYLVETGLEARFVAADHPGRAVALTSRGAVLLDPVGRTTEIYPYDGFDVREVTDVILHEANLWVGTLRGLHRFSLDWKSWDRAFGGKTMRRSAILRLELADEIVNQRVVARTLYAVTSESVYIYRTGFDDFERIGL
jgi:ligand-binding sensor domain-containing protein